MQRWFTDSTKYVYAVRGLRLEPGEIEAVPPCTFGATSRWIRTSSSGGCSGSTGTATTTLAGGTAAVVEAAITAYGQPLDVNAPYTAGPNAKNSGYICDKDWVGSLDDAVVKCNKDTSCRYLHNYKGDGKTWRVCESVDFVRHYPPAFSSIEDLMGCRGCHNGLRATTIIPTPPTPPLSSVPGSKLPHLC